MRVIKQLVSEKAKEMAKSAVRTSVGKSIYIYGHVWEIPEEVEKWVIGSRDIRSADQRTAVD